MARWLKQSTSVDVPIGPFLDNLDGFTAETALTLTQPDIRLKKNGGAWAQKNAAQTLSHEENGFYEVTLDATDTNTLGLLRLAVFETGALPLWEDFLVVPANVWDSLFGADLLDVNAAEIATTPVTSIADGLLKRDMSAVTGESSRSMLNALRFLRNKWTLTGTALSVKKEDDSTEAWASTVTTDAAAEPITGSDPS